MNDGDLAGKSQRFVSREDASEPDAETNATTGAHEYWIGLYEQQLQYCRHHETQRTAVAGFLVSLAVACMAVITSDGEMRFTDLPIVLLLALTAYITNSILKKHYERYRFHDMRADAYRERAATAAGVDVKSVNSTVDTVHYQTFPFRRSLSDLWLRLIVLVGLLSLVMLTMILASEFTKRQ